MLRIKRIMLYVWGSKNLWISSGITIIFIGLKSIPEDVPTEWQCVEWNSDVRKNANSNLLQLQQPCFLAGVVVLERFMKSTLFFNYCKKFILQKLLVPILWTIKHNQFPKRCSRAFKNIRFLWQKKHHQPACFSNKIFNKWCISTFK